MKMGQQKFLARSSVGFSLPELMVVLVILGILASLALPRLRAFIARSRQAEAKNLLAQIHTLQTTHQNLKDRFASWAKGATQVGKGGTCTFTASTASSCVGHRTTTPPTTDSACTTAGGTWQVTTPGPHELGFKPQNCNQLRYGYWILKGVDANGIERYVAYAYGPSDVAHRIYPTCNGKKTGRSDTIQHPTAGTWTGTRPSESVTQGDLQALDEDKTWFHSDIIPNCE